VYKETVKTADEKMDKTIAVVQKELSTLRAGRANPKILDRILVDYYGTPTPINQLGNISSPEPRLLVIAPWETKLISMIEKEIQKSDIGINPSNDGKVIRLMIPELTEERRRDLCKQVRKEIEDGKIAVRAVRREAMEQLKKLKKDTQITEDDQKTAENDVQKATDAHIKELDKIGADKEKEIMSV
jgi:ribosome recycling factor